MVGMKKCSVLFVATTYLMIVANASDCRAQILVWTGNVDNQFFAVPGNWAPNTLPNNSSDIRFTGAPTASNGLRIFDGTSVNGIRVLDGAAANLRPEGAFGGVFLEVGGSSTGATGTFSTLNLVNFNNNTRLQVVGATVGGFNSNLFSPSGNLANMQINAGTVLEAGVVIVGGSGNSGFLSAIGGGMINASELSIGRNVTGDATFGSVVVQGTDSTLNVLHHTIIGQTFSGGAPTEGGLEASGGSVNLDSVVVGSGTDSNGLLTARFSGSVFATSIHLGTVDGEGEGNLVAASGGIVNAQEIVSQTGSSLINAQAGGCITTSELELNSGLILVDGGSIVSGSNLNLRGDSSLHLFSGNVETQNIVAIDDSAIVWSGGQVRLNAPAPIIGADGLFHRQISVPPLGTLAFAHSVQIQSRLQVDGMLMAPGIVCTGELILNDASVIGATRLLDGSAVLVDGVVTFNGSVEGASGFEGADSTVQFLSSFLPGSDSGEGVSIQFDGNVEFGLDSCLKLTILGAKSGEFDSLKIDGELQIDGEIEFEFPVDFDIESSDELIVIETEGDVLGEFSNFPDGQVFTNEHGRELEISYSGGDGNDIVVRAIGTSVLVGDINLDGAVNLLDVQPFIELLSNGMFQAEADINGDGMVDLLDVGLFVDLLGA